VRAVSADARALPSTPPGALHRFTAAVLDPFVPAPLLADAEQSRRARTLVGFAFFSVLPGAIFVTLSAVNYRTSLTTGIAAASMLTSLVTPFLLRRTGSIALATSAMLAVFVATTLVGAASSEGQAAVSLPWLAVVPLLGTALAGRRAGVFWAIACVAVAEVLLGFDWTALLPQALIATEARRIGTAWNIALLVLFVGGFAILYESIRLRTMAALADANARLETARAIALHTERLASLGRMAAGVAHEINNPMTFVSSNVALLLEDLQRGQLDPALCREYVEDVLPATNEGIGRIIATVRALRLFARGESGPRAAFDLNDEVRGALRSCEDELAGRRLVLRLAELPPVVGRADDLAQVVRNLVVNAADAAGPRGEVRVDTESAGDEVVLRVTDDGPGMTPEVRARLFEPFFTTKPVGDRAGLGLAVVHGILRDHGGSVRVDTEPGRGSVFEVRIPRGSPEPPR
jgi:signal transduction histidine kinase